MRIVRGFWVILLVLVGCGHTSSEQLVDRSGAEDELYAMAMRALLDDSRFSRTVFCLGLQGRPPHPAFFARFATHPARVEPQSACTGAPRELPDGREASFLPMEFEPIDWSKPERPLVRASIIVARGYEVFELEMRFARDGERWRVRHRSLKYSGCTEQAQLW
ncbi:hypothetical protein [Archangium lansingense]|uniref:Lipoprotein n=1 Tax=Archangium lansingense TaxID=2995310 RepID=A0ABT3ZVX2_9BACT|nr:hypothetical protein [Archangium lansinium]MCY1073538.1 hypothetical protein [Archangium lansinium]